MRQRTIAGSQEQELTLVQQVWADEHVNIGMPGLHCHFLLGLCMTAFVRQPQV